MVNLIRNLTVRQRLTLGALVIALSLVGLFIYQSGRRQPFLAQTFTPAAPEPPNTSCTPTINVRDHGATGDGVTNDREAVRAAIQAAPNGAMIYFPPGTYLMNDVFVTDRVGLCFVGEGAATILKKNPLPGNVTMLIIRGGSDFILRNLTVDMNGLVQFGGVNLSSVTRVEIRDNRFFDSNRVTTPCCDLYAVVFSRGSTPSTDLAITRNQFEDLQLEVDHSRRVAITDNVSERGCCTAGIGGFSVAFGDPGGSVMEDYLIARNTVTNAVGARGITMQLDPGSDNNVIVRRVRIANNTIRRTTGTRPVTPIFIGAPNNSLTTTGNVFENIAIEDNTIDLQTSGGDGEMAIFGTSTICCDFFLTRLTLRGNTIRGAGTGYGIYLIKSRDSDLLTNDVRGFYGGMTFDGSPSTTVVEGNTIEATWRGIVFWNSAGGNRVTGNLILGDPEQPCEFIGGLPSDLFECQGSPPPPPPSPPPPPPPLPGDFDGDQRVDQIDLNLFRPHWSPPAPYDQIFDLNNPRDGRVNSSDAGILFSHWTG